MLRKKFARRDEEYDSMIGVVRETPPELVLPDNILPGKLQKAVQWYLSVEIFGFIVIALWGCRLKYELEKLVQYGAYFFILIL